MIQLEIQNDIINLVFTVLKAATSNIQILFSSHNTFYKLVNMGILELLKKSVYKNRLEIQVLVNVEKEVEITKIK